jgi:diamine N-acetyltransferase
MIYLRELTRADIGIINEWRRDKKVQSSLVSPFRYVNIETDDKWFNDYLAGGRANNVRCAICLRKTKEIVGVVYLLNIDYVSRSADVGMMIGKKELQNKGIGVFALKIMLDHAFIDLNLHRVYSAPLEYNDRSIKVAEMLGFRREGTLRESAYKEGKYHNQIVMGLLKHEYLTKISSLGKATWVKNLIARNDGSTEVLPLEEEGKDNH